jgi:hypothetical protein
MRVELIIRTDIETKIEDLERIQRMVGLLIEGGGNTVTHTVVGDTPSAAAAAKPATVVSPAKPTPAPRGRPPKAATAAGNGGKPATPPVDSGLADDDPTDLAGPTDPDDEDALGLSAPSMTPHEALEQGLGIARDLYAGGHRGPVKEVQQKWGVAKFTDIPSTDGHKFLKTMMDLQGKLGLRV